MAQKVAATSLPDFFAQQASLFESLFSEANGERWGLSCYVFTEALRRGAEKRFHGGPADPAAIVAYLRSLHIEDLALACACGVGIEAAWEFFVAHFWHDLRSASRAILRSSGSGNDERAEELADSLYAELYGVRSTRGGKRKSLFEYFHGRSKLSTWLRAVLAQRHVDLLRADRATISLDGEPDSEKEKPRMEIAQPADSSVPDPCRAKYVAMVDRALVQAVASLLPRERMLIAGYYEDQLTLAEIGRMLREHESTISRQLERARTKLREAVTEALRLGVPANDGNAAVPALDNAQVELAFEYALEDWPFDLSRALSNAETPADISGKET